MSGTDYTFTPNYNFYKPVPDADDDAWGGHLNTNFDTLDALLHSIQTAAAVTSFNGRSGAVTFTQADLTAAGGATTAQLANYVPIAGGTMTGPLLLSADATNGLGAVTLRQLNAVSGVTSFNSRTGAITLQPADVTGVGFYTGAASDARYVYKGGDTMSGDLTLPNLYATGSVDGANLVTTGAVYCNTGLFQIASNYYMQRSPSDGAWRWVENGTINLTLDTAGNLTARGNVNAVSLIASSTVQGAYIHDTGTLQVDGDVHSGSGVFYVAGNGNCYLQHVASNGTWYWVENSTVNMWLDGGGNLNVRTASYLNQVYAQYGLFAGANGDSSFGMYRASGANLFQYAAGWSLTFNTSTGDQGYTNAGTGTMWYMARASDLLFYNALGTVGGYGAYQNYSDARGKHSVEDAPYGLEQIKKLRPVRFQRHRHQKMPDRVEVGFIAQEVREVLPEAVVVMGIPLPDGTGGLEDDEPSLGLDSDVILAALVKAVQELAAR